MFDEHKTMKTLNHKKQHIDPYNNFGMWSDMHTYENSKKGFLLIELIVSVAIFIVIVTVALGSLVVIFESNRQASSLRLALDNANFALNSMSREMRLGSGFTCNSAVCDGDSKVSFDYFGKQIVYELNNNNIVEKQIDGGPLLPLTSDRHDIHTLRFTQAGTEPDMVTIYMEGTALVGNQSTDFDIQTSISSRKL